MKIDGGMHLSWLFCLLNSEGNKDFLVHLDEIADIALQDVLIEKCWCGNEGNIRNITGIKIVLTLNVSINECTGYF